MRAQTTPAPYSRVHRKTAVQRRSSTAHTRRGRRGRTGARSCPRESVSSVRSPAQPQLSALAHCSVSHVVERFIHRRGYLGGLRQSFHAVRHSVPGLSSEEHAHGHVRLLAGLRPDDGERSRRRRWIDSTPVHHRGCPARRGLPERRRRCSARRDQAQERLLFGQWGRFSPPAARLDDSLTNVARLRTLTSTIATACYSFCFTGGRQAKHGGCLC